MCDKKECCGGCATKTTTESKDEQLSEMVFEALQKVYDMDKDIYTTVDAENIGIKLVADILKLFNNE